jgi:diguanylate cyclase (GGDEF)-like protein
MTRERFRLRLLLAAVLPTLLFTVLISGVWLSWFQQELHDSHRSRAQAVARQLASAAEFHLFTRDTAALTALLKSITTVESDIVAAAILDRQGILIAHAGENIHVDALRAEPVWSEGRQAQVSRLTLPILADPLPIDDLQQAAPQFAAGGPAGRLLGYVAVEVSHADVLAQRDRVITLAVLLVLLAAAAGGLLAVLLSKGVTDSISRINAVVWRIGQGDLAARIQGDPRCVLHTLEQGINRMAEQVALNQDELQRRIDAATAELKAQKRDAELEARIDPLTGLGNRRAFMERGEAEVLRANRYGSALAMVMLDLDHFKQVNDVHGHDAGDRVLVALAELLRGMMREVDFVARLGGEEFAILMPDTGAEEAVRAAARIRQKVEMLAVDAPGASIRCTASFGVTEFVPGDTVIQDLFVRADRLLYKAKQGGRNRVEH